MSAFDNFPLDHACNSFPGDRKETIPLAVIDARIDAIIDIFARNHPEIAQKMQDCRSHAKIDPSSTGSVKLARRCSARLCLWCHLKLVAKRQYECREAYTTAIKNHPSAQALMVTLRMHMHPDEFKTTMEVSTNAWNATVDDCREKNLTLGIYRSISFEALSTEHLTLVQHAILMFPGNSRTRLDRQDDVDYWKWTVRNRFARKGVEAEAVVVRSRFDATYGTASDVPLAYLQTASRVGYDPNRVFTDPVNLTACEPDFVEKVHGLQFDQDLSWTAGCFQRRHWFKKRV